MKLLKHNDADPQVVAAKLLMGVISINEKVEDPESYIKAGQAFGADLVARVCAWQDKHKLTADGEIGPKTWAALAAAAPTCSTSKHRVSAATMALQILLEGAKLTADAIYGRRTKAAVAAFQAASGLSADGVCGPKTWKALISGSSAAEVPPQAATPGQFKKPANYKQHDPKWGSKMYSNHNNKKQTMANSGCGPTAMADAAAVLIDPGLDPWDLARLAMQWGDRTASSGTDTSFFKHIQAKYGFKRMVGTGSLATLKACLDAGGYAICRMGKGYWTTGGHYICAWKYDDQYVYCCDPSSPSSRRKEERVKQKQSDFLKQRKDFWCFFPERAA